MCVLRVPRPLTAHVVQTAQGLHTIIFQALVNMQFYWHIFKSFRVNGYASTDGYENRISGVESLT